MQAALRSTVCNTDRADFGRVWTGVRRHLTSTANDRHLKNVGSSEMSCANRVKQASCVVDQKDIQYFRFAGLIPAGLNDQTPPRKECGCAG